MKSTIQTPAGKGRTAVQTEDQALPGVRNPQVERVEDVMRALKLNLMTAGLTMDDVDQGSDPYNSRPGAARKEIWNGSRRR